MVDVITESVRNGQFIAGEISHDYTRSRNSFMVAEGFIPSGTLLGRKTKGAQTVAAAAVAGNTTNDTIGTLSAAAGAAAGKWPIVGVAGVANAGVFQVFRPDLTYDGVGKVGVAYDSKAAGGIAFTITDGSTDMAPGDRYEFTVSYAAGDGDLYPLDLAAHDGTEKFAEILVNGGKFPATRTPVVTIKAGHANVYRNFLYLKDGLLFTSAFGITDQQRAVIEADMAAKLITTLTAR